MGEKRLETLMEILDYSAGLLEKNNIEDARLNAELMLSHILECDRVRLYLDFEKPLSIEEKESFKVLLKRRLGNEPLQYILGKTSFFGYDIHVNGDVLIPRPETEILVEKILEDILGKEKKEVVIFEVGTGSGCIPVALAKELEKTGTGYKIFSIDKSAEALAVAKKNLEMNGILADNIKLLEKDFFTIEKLDKKIDYLVSNPPYISKRDYESLPAEIKEHEPFISLTDEGEGLSFYKRILSLLGKSDFEFKTFCEIGYNQYKDLNELATQTSFKNVKFHKDYSGIFRIMEIDK